MGDLYKTSFKDCLKISKPMMLKIFSYILQISFRNFSKNSLRKFSEVVVWIFEKCSKILFPKSSTDSFQYRQQKKNLVIKHRFLNDIIQKYIQEFIQKILQVFVKFFFCKFFLFIFSKASPEFASWICSEILNYFQRIFLVLLTNFYQRLLLKI